MNVVILCGGLGTRLAEETSIKPKPMVEIGDRPILWHIMKIYEKFGYINFTLALGYKGEVIKDFFLNYHPRQSDLSVHLLSGNVEYENPTAEDWLVTMIDTGQFTLTGGRLLRLKSRLAAEGSFMLTYGDGVSDINIDELVKFHKSHGKIATVTAVRPTARFGGIELNGDAVSDFKEKPQAGEGWINGGFFVFEPEVFDYISGDKSILEKETLEGLVSANELMAFKHEGFWQCMDTVRDREFLQNEIEAGRAVWLENE